MRLRNSDLRKKKEILRRKDGFRLAVMLFLAGALLFLMFSGAIDVFVQTKLGGTQDQGRPSVVVEEVPAPFIDKKLLETVRDETRTQRFIEEKDAAEHLLLVANQLFPATLRKLGMPLSPVPIGEIRRNPARFRGMPLFYQGEIMFMESPQKVPGLHNTYSTRGFLQTEDKEVVLFRVVEPVPEGLKKGSYARIEGLFFKLRDSNTFKFEKAPLLYGPSLRSAFRKFEPVKELDPDILARIRDSTQEEASVIEPIPLYHLASYAMNRGGGREWEDSLPKPGAEEALALRKGDIPFERGRAYRLLAGLYHVQVVQAEANPLGVDQWSRVWAHHRDLGTIEARIPKSVGIDWKVAEDIVFNGHFMKMHYYEVPSRVPGQRIFRNVPFFVADKLYRWVLVEPPSNAVFRIVMCSIFALLVVLFVFLVRRDTRAEKQVMQRILERRKARRARGRA